MGYKTKSIVTAYVDFEGIEKLPSWQAVLEKDLQTALRRANVKTRRWLQTRVIDSVSGELKIAKKALRPRFYFGGKAKDLQVVLWIGLFPITLFRASHRKPHQTRHGVRAYNKIYPHSFIAVMSKGNFHKGVFFRKGKNRLPIDEHKIEISAAAEHNVRKLVEGPVQQYWQKTFKHELNYAMGLV